MLCIPRIIFWRLLHLFGCCQQNKGQRQVKVRFAGDGHTMRVVADNPIVEEEDEDEEAEDDEDVDSDGFNDI